MKSEKFVTACIIFNYNSYLCTLKRDSKREIMENQKDDILLKERSSRACISAGYRLYTGHFKHIFRYSCVAALVYALFCSLVGAVMVTAPTSVLDECARMVAKIDRKPRQVYVEARFVELKNSAAYELGIDWSGIGQLGVTASGGAGLTVQVLFL